MHLGVLAPAERPRDADAESGGKSKNRRSKRSGLESESGDPRPRCQDLSWRINR